MAANASDDMSDVRDWIAFGILAGMTILGVALLKLCYKFNSMCAQISLLFDCVIMHVTV